MPTKEMMQPVRISELKGYSTDKKIGSEKKMMQPVKIKDLLESCSKSCSKTMDRSMKPKFTMPDRSVRRKLYGVTPSPQKTRQSFFPSQTSKLQPSIFTSQFIPKSLPRPSISSSKSTENLKSRMSLFQPSQLEKTKVNANVSRKSFLPRPNSIVQKHIGKTLIEKPTMEMSTLLEDPETSDVSIIEKTIENEEATSPVEGRQDPNEKSPEKKDFSDENKTRPTVIKCIDSERLRKLESDIEELRRDVEDIKSHQKSQNDLLEKIYEAICRKSNVDINNEKKSVEEISLTPKKQIEVADLSEKINSESELIKNDFVMNSEKNKKKLSSGKKRRKSNIAIAERRRSLRLADKNASMINDSFTKLEEQLSIKNLNPENPQNDQENINCKTPMRERNKRLGKSDKPLREYLAMKASMNFLETPDINRFKKSIEPVDDTPFGGKNLRRSISSKLFDELQDLYRDSPGSDSAC